MKYTSHRNSLLGFIMVFVACLFAENSIAATGVVKWFDPQKGYGFTDSLGSNIFVYHPEIEKPIKWFDPQKGYGFTDSLGSNIFVYHPEIEKPIKMLKPGQKVEFDVAPEAVKVKVQE